MPSVLLWTQKRMRLKVSIMSGRRKKSASVVGKADTDLFSEVYGVNESNPFEHGIVLHLPKSVDDVIGEQQAQVATGQRTSGSDAIPAPAGYAGNENVRYWMTRC